MGAALVAPRVPSLATAVSAVLPRLGLLFLFYPPKVPTKASKNRELCQNSVGNKLLAKQEISWCNLISVYLGLV